jgi:hypothetical protein
MDRDIDIIQVLVICEVFFEILHVGDKDCSITLEVLVSLLPLIANMYDNLVAWMADWHPGISS